MEEKKNPFKKTLITDLSISGVFLIALVGCMFAWNCHIDKWITIMGLAVVVGCTVILVFQNKKMKKFIDMQ